MAAAPTNTLVRSAVVGEREDLENEVYRVAPEEKPLTTMVGKEKIKNILHEHQTDTLANRNPNNAAYEGGDVGTHAALAQPTRVSCYAQIFTNDGAISGTVDAADLAGRETEMARQKTKLGIELTLDMECRFMGNYASVAETPASVTRKTAGALAHITTVSSSGSGGSVGGFSSAGVVAAATNGTQRALTETLLKAILVSGFNTGARYSKAFMSGTHKQVAGGFTGLADIRATVSGNQQATIYGAADRYVSDFGPIDFIPTIDLSRDMLVIDPNAYFIGTYRGVFTQDLAITGDSIPWQTIAEKGFFCRNQKKAAAIRDLL